MSILAHKGTKFYEIKIDGNFDKMMISEAKQIFSEVADTVEIDVRIDMADAEFLDSSGVGALVQLHKRLKFRGYALSIVNLREQPYGVLSRLRIDKIITLTKR